MKSFLLDSHHWYDVLAGAVIGATGAFASYRMSYASIWDYRFNHIPLPRPKSSWSPFSTERTNGTGLAGQTNGIGLNHTAPEYFTYASGTSTFPSFAHPRDWHPVGAPGDAWNRSGGELEKAEMQFGREARMRA